MNYFEEKKYDWGKRRWGKFTGSAIYQLLEKGSGTTFGKGAMTYINQVACEAYTSYEQNDFKGSWDMREGQRKEPEAAKFYSSIISKLLVQGQPLRPEYFGDVNPTFIDYNEHSGVSPDMALYFQNNPYLIAEFKCPKRDTQFDRMIELKKYPVDQKHLYLKEKCKDYYGQVQFGMMTMKVNMAHFVSYNEYFPMDERAIIIQVPADKPYQNNLDLTLSLAIQEKLRILETLKNQNNG